MRDTTKPIRLSGHACQQIQFRGATDDEVSETIRSGEWQVAEGGRIECRRDFPFNAIWNKKQYATKQVRPIFVEESTEVVVVTVTCIIFEGVAHENHL